MAKVSKERPRLGRGLSTLISGMSAVQTQVPENEDSLPNSSQDTPLPVEPATEAVSVPLEIRVAEIAANPHQPRKEFADGGLAELAESLKSTGLIQPIIVRRVEEGYQLIAGERRLRAAKLAGMTSIPAIVRDVDGLTQAQMALVENTQREDLNPVDRAMAYRTLQDQLGLTQSELAQRLGEDRSSIANHLRLLDLSEFVRRLVAAGVLSLGHAKVLAGVADTADQDRIAALVQKDGLSVRALELAIAIKSPEKPRAAAKPGSTHYEQMEKTISRQLGMRVQVRAAGKAKGRLVIHYGSLDQFDELVGKLGVTLEE